MGNRHVIKFNLSTLTLILKIVFHRAKSSPIAALPDGLCSGARPDYNGATLDAGATRVAFHDNA